jgi:hypothetical protein
MLLLCVTNCLSSILYIFNLVAESVTILTILLFVMLDCVCLCVCVCVCVYVLVYL